MAKTINTVKKTNDNAGNFANEYVVVYTDGTLSAVPLNTDNKDYRQIQAWVNAGNTIAEAD